MSKQINSVEIRQELETLYQNIGFLRQALPKENEGYLGYKITHIPPTAFESFLIDVNQRIGQLVDESREVNDEGLRSIYTNQNPAHQPIFAILSLTKHIRSKAADGLQQIVDIAENIKTAANNLTINLGVQNEQEGSENGFDPKTVDSLLSKAKSRSNVALEKPLTPKEIKKSFAAIKETSRQQPTPAGKVSTIAERHLR